jgi:hypothetical protein
VIVVIGPNRDITAIGRQRVKISLEINNKEQETYINSGAAGCAEIAG